MADSSVSRQKMEEILENSDNEDIEFWEQLLEEGKITFQNSIEEVQKIRDRSIEFMKIILLLGSFYVAVLQFGFEGTQPISNNYLLYIPFIPLFISTIPFFHTYIIPNSHTIGTNTKNAHISISEGYNKLEYTKIMSAVYFYWGDDNMDIVSKSIKIQLFGVGCIFSSLGAVAGIILRL
ncbi:hypothetical protein ACFR99_07305 [Haloarchaeobius amylolyticus]|uniref:Uncharacterized protein n=1 Tax=Haloarchaeobius amylolyticus TaxID=1198296 RepID=A0ABD6BEK0_9EURY